MIYSYNYYVINTYFFQISIKTPINNPIAPPNKSLCNPLYMQVTIIAFDATTGAPIQTGTATDRARAACLARVQFTFDRGEGSSPRPETIFF